MVTLLVQLCSVNNGRFYIPGETKETEMLKRKAICNGLFVIADLIIKTSQV
jgi:hypothetical protein